MLCYVLKNHSATGTLSWPGACSRKESTQASQTAESSVFVAVFSGVFLVFSCCFTL